MTAGVFVAQRVRNPHKRVIDRLGAVLGFVGIQQVDVLCLLAHRRGSPICGGAQCYRAPCLSLLLFLARKPDRFPQTSTTTPFTPSFFPSFFYRHGEHNVYSCTASYLHKILPTSLWHDNYVAILKVAAFIENSAWVKQWLATSYNTNAQ